MFLFHVLFFNSPKIYAKYEEDFSEKIYYKMCSIFQFFNLVFPSAEMKLREKIFY